MSNDRPISTVSYAEDLVRRVRANDPQAFDELYELSKTVALRRKLSRDIGFEHGKIIRELQRRFAARAKGNARTLLLAEREFVPFNSKLTEEFSQRRPFYARANVVRHRVEAYVVLAPVKAVETV